MTIRGHPFMTSTQGGQAQIVHGRMWTGSGGQAPCGRPHRKLKLESADVILLLLQRSLAASLVYGALGPVLPLEFWKFCAFYSFRQFNCNFLRIAKENMYFHVRLQRVHYPWAYEAFPSVSEKLVSKSQRKVKKKFFTTRFPEKVFHFSLPKYFWWPFLVIDHYFRIFRFPDCKFPICPPISPVLPLSPYFSDVLTIHILAP